MRWCTRQLKLRPFERYVGDDKVVSYVGIRADEDREGYVSTKPNIQGTLPFKEDGLGKADIIRILEEAGLGLPSYYKWRTRSGCYFCFFQRKSEWAGLLEHHPDLFELSKQYHEENRPRDWSALHLVTARPRRTGTARATRADQAQRTGGCRC